jgi:hypothetical protein
VRELRIDDRRAQVGEQVEMLAQPQQALLGTLRTRQRVVLRSADRAEQDGVGLASASVAAGSGSPRRRRRRRRPAPDSARSQAVKRQRLQNTNRLSGDLGADAIARQHCIFHRSIPFGVGLTRGQRRLPAWRGQAGSRDRETAGPGSAHQSLGEPGLLGANAFACLEGANFVGVPQGQADLVEAVEQAVLAEGIDVEFETARRRRGDDLLRAGRWSVRTRGRH